MNKINIDNWKEFAMCDLGFKNYHGKRLKKSDRLEGNIPFITAGKENQGVVGCIGNFIMKAYLQVMIIYTFL